MIEALISWWAFDRMAYVYLLLIFLGMDVLSQPQTFSSASVCRETLCIVFMCLFGWFVLSLGVVCQWSVSTVIVHVVTEISATLALLVLSFSLLHTRAHHLWNMRDALLFKCWRSVTFSDVFESSHAEAAFIGSNNTVKTVIYCVTYYYNFK